MSSYGTMTGRHGKHVLHLLTSANVETGFDLLVARTTNWAVNPTLAGTSEWGDSDSGGYTNRAPGRKDCTFTTEGKYQKTVEAWDLFRPEDIVRSTLYMDMLDVLRTGSSYLFWDFPRSLCSDFSMTVDVDSEEVIGWSASWGADGIYYEPGRAPVGHPTRVPAYA